ncbi:MAG: DUF4469 domain-containing protein [Chloroflexi bacterium]|nr:DUF4469 domain-containing protein [Chloroflexota bacterium]
MPIKYRIVENNLKPGSYYARVVQRDVITLEQMIPNVVAKTALSGTDVKAVASAITDELVATLAAGHTAVIDGMVRFTVSISGSFENGEVTITKDNAHLNVVAHDERALESAVAARASYSRETARVKAPLVDRFFDIATSAYDQYTAGSIVRFNGEDLKFNLANSDEGVFVNDGTTETRLTIYSVAGNKQIDALIPAGVSGPLSITVRARYTEGGELRQSTYRRQVAQA